MKEITVRKGKTYWYKRFLTCNDKTYLYGTHFHCDLAGLVELGRSWRRRRSGTISWHTSASNCDNFRARLKNQELWKYRFSCAVRYLALQLTREEIVETEFQILQKPLVEGNLLQRFQRLSISRPFDIEITSENQNSSITRVQANNL